MGLISTLKINPFSPFPPLLKIDTLWFHFSTGRQFSATRGSDFATNNDRAGHFSMEANLQCYTGCSGGYFEYHPFVY